MKWIPSPKHRSELERQFGVPVGARQADLEGGAGAQAGVGQREYVNTEY
jgi:hypothetical protein